MKVIEKAGKDFPVLAKLNLSGGFTPKTHFYLMPGKVSLWGMIKNGSTLAEKITMALFGPLIIKRYRFRENFFLDQARRMRKTVKMPLVYLGGVDSRKGIGEVLAAGFEFIAIARALIHEPEFLMKLKDGQIEKSDCTRCNQCMVQIDRDGVKCVL